MEFDAEKGGLRRRIAGNPDFDQVGTVLNGLRIRYCPGAEVGTGLDGEMGFRPGISLQGEQRAVTGRLDLRVDES